MYIYSMVTGLRFNVYISHKNAESEMHGIVYSCLGVQMWNSLIEADYRLPQSNISKQILL